MSIRIHDVSLSWSNLSMINYLNLGIVPSLFLSGPGSHREKRAVFWNYGPRHYWPGHLYVERDGSNCAMSRWGRGPAEERTCHAGARSSSHAHKSGLKRHVKRRVIFLPIDRCTENQTHRLDSTIRSQQSRPNWPTMSMLMEMMGAIQGVDCSLERLSQSVLFFARITSLIFPPFYKICR
jgi:hypothetical protein